LNLPLTSDEHPLTIKSFMEAFRMLALDSLDELLHDSNVVVFTTFRRDGMPQQSLVTVAKSENKLYFTTRSTNAKILNLTRDERCAVMVVSQDRRSFAALDGTAEIISSNNSDPEVLRLRLREVFELASGKQHPDWQEYDRVMIEQRRVIVSFNPNRIVGHNI